MIYHKWKSTNADKQKIIEALAKRHSGFTNQCFGDGHAATVMTVKDWNDVSDTASGDKAKRGITDKVHFTIPID